MSGKTTLKEQVDALSTENAELRQQLDAVVHRLAAVEQNTSTPRPIAKPPRPNGSLTSRVQERYFNQKRLLQTQLRQTLQDNLPCLALLPYSGPQRDAQPGHWLDPTDLSPMPCRVITADELPRAVAAYLTGEAFAQQEYKGLVQFKEITPHDMTPRIERAEVELAALKECTADLVDSTPLTLHPRFTGKRQPAPAPVIPAIINVGASR